MHISFIGGGNMATALIAGLVRDDIPAGHIHVADPSVDVRARLSDRFGVDVHADGRDVAPGSDAVVLAVKPQIMPAVLDSLGGRLEERQVVISVAAGIMVRTIQKRLRIDSVVRAMPNTPALLGAGVTGIYPAPACSRDQVALAERILSAAGATVRVDSEAQMDAVTAVSGSGPAYFFLLIEALRDAGESVGLPADAANTLAVHTAYGAGLMAHDGNADVSELRRRVTSPGGTTHAALETFAAGGFRELVRSAVRAANERGRELSLAGDDA